MVWVTARRREGETGIFDFVALLVALVVRAVIVVFSVEAANTQNKRPCSLGYPAADIDDFLANQSSLHERVQETVDAQRTRCLFTQAHRLVNTRHLQD